MGLLTALLAPPKAERRGIPDLPFMYAAQSTAGVAVTEMTAMQSTTVYACVRILADTVGSLPLIVYERLPDGGKQRAANHPLYGLLHDQPNPEMTSLQWRETCQAFLSLWGNAYSRIEFNGAGRVVGLVPLRADWTEVSRRNGSLIYTYTPPGVGKPDIYSAAQILHVGGLGFNGVTGFSPIAMARNAIGLSLATEEFGSRFFSNGATAGGVLEYPGVLDDPAYERLKKEFEEQYHGLGNAGSTIVLEEGAKYHAISIPPNDAQFLETRKFQIAEIARIFRIPPHMVGDLDRATFSNIEHQSLEFVIHTLRPWLVRWEQAINARLLTPAERGRYFVEFLVDGLLRGDIKSRYEAYSIGRQNGWLSADDIRGLENMNPLPDGQGEMYLVPLNMVPADQAGAPVPAATPDKPTPAQRSETRATDGYPAAIMQRHRLMQAYTPLFLEALARVYRREAQDVAAEAKKQLNRRDVAKLEVWVRDFYREHEEFFRLQMRHVIFSYADLLADNAAQEIGRDAGPDMGAFTASFLTEWARRHAAKQQQRVIKAITKNEPDAAEMLDAELESWRESRPNREAQDEAVRAGNAIAMAALTNLGTRRFRWYTFGDNCPYCNSLSGRTVGISEPFVHASTPFGPVDGTPMILSNSIHHAPAHEGCNCMVGAG